MSGRFQKPCYSPSNQPCHQRLTFASGIHERTGRTWRLRPPQRQHVLKTPRARPRRRTRRDDWFQAGTESGPPSSEETPLARISHTTSLALEKTGGAGRFTKVSSFAKNTVCVLPILPKPVESSDCLYGDSGAVQAHRSQPGHPGGQSEDVGYSCLASQQRRFDQTC
jgi:hypothetical protein